MHSFPSKEGASVEFFPTAFAIPIGLVKLVQGLWLLDHHDHQVIMDQHNSQTFIYPWDVFRFLDSRRIVIFSVHSFILTLFSCFSWSEFFRAASASCSISVSVWVAARAGSASTDVPGPTFGGTAILPHHKAPNFLHCPGQTLPVCFATQQVKMILSSCHVSLKTRVKHALCTLKTMCPCFTWLHSVLYCYRCLIEAWSLLRQHSSRLNMAELMGFLYESCQELGLIKELLKLPLGLSEQVRQTWVSMVVPVTKIK